jgi:RHS repeat-associated protein
VHTSASNGYSLRRLDVPGLTLSENVAKGAAEVRRTTHGQLAVTMPAHNTLLLLQQPDAAANQVLTGAYSWPTLPTHTLLPHLALQPLIIHNQQERFTRTLDQKNYELTDHLGNVRVVVGDRKLSDFTGWGIPDHFRAEVRSRSDYYPFGSLLPGRNYSSDSYRFGFQGQEKDDEVFGSTGTSYTAEFWQYDPRVARRWNPDPIVKHHESPYAAFANSPIWIIDQLGADSTVYLYSKLDDQGNAMYSMDQLNTMAKEAQNIANLNGLDYVKFKATTLHDLETNKDLNLNPYTDLIYRVADDIALGTINPGVTASSLSNTVIGPNSFQGMTFVHGEIYPNEVSEAGGNFNVTAGITIAHEAFTHGYNNVVSHLFGEPVWSNHGGSGLEAAYGTRFYGNSYTTLRTSESTTLHTNTVIKQLFNFGSGPFATGMPKGLERYKYSSNDAINTYFRGVLNYHFKK